MVRQAQIQIGDQRFECSWPDAGYTDAYIADKIGFEARMLVEKNAE